MSFSNVLFDEFGNLFTVECIDFDHDLFMTRCYSLNTTLKKVVETWPNLLCVPRKIQERQKYGKRVENKNIMVTIERHSYKMLRNESTYGHRRQF